MKLEDVKHYDLNKLFGDYTNIMMSDFIYSDYFRKIPLLLDQPHNILTAIRMLDNRCSFLTHLEGAFPQDCRVYNLEMLLPNHGLELECLPRWICKVDTLDKRHPDGYYLIEDKPSTLNKGLKSSACTPIAVECVYNTRDIEPGVIRCTDIVDALIFINNLEYYTERYKYE